MGIGTGSIRCKENRGKEYWEENKDSWNQGHLSDELQTLFSGNAKESMR